MTMETSKLPPHLNFEGTASPGCKEKHVFLQYGAGRQCIFQNDIKTNMLKQVPHKCVWNNPTPSKVWFVIQMMALAVERLPQRKSGPGNIA